MGRRILLEHIGIPGIRTFDVYRANGGYRAVEKALKEMTPAEVILITRLKTIWSALAAWGPGDLR